MGTWCRHRFRNTITFVALDIFFLGVMHVCLTDVTNLSPWRALGGLEPLLRQHDHEPCFGTETKPTVPCREGGDGLRKKLTIVSLPLTSHPHNTGMEHPGFSQARLRFTRVMLLVATSNHRCVCCTNWFLLCGFICASSLTECCPFGRRDYSGGVCTLLCEEGSGEDAKTIDPNPRVFYCHGV